MANIKQQLSRPQLSPEVLDQYKLFVMKKYPNISKDQMSKLDDFIDQKKQQLYTQYSGQAVEQGIITPQQGVQYGGAGILPTLLNLKQQGKLPTELSERENKTKEAQQNAEKIISQLEDQYYGLQTKGDELSYGRVGGILQKGIKFIGQNPRLKVFDSYVQSIRPTLARAAGDSGNFSEPEQKASVAIIPGATSTPEEAALAFKWLRRKFQLPERDISQMGGFSLSPDTYGGKSEEELLKEQEDKLNKILGF